MRSAYAILAFLVVVFGTAPARAAKRSASRQAKENAARKACLTGDFRTGIDLLADLFIETKDQNNIYNQGRCFEQNGKNDQAVLRFKEYLRKAKNLPKSESEAVLGKIEELQGAARKHEVEAVPAPTPPPSATQAAAPSPALPPSAAVATTSDPLGIAQSAPPPEPRESPPVYKRWWFWTGIGAVVAGGVVTGVLLSKKSAPKSPACDGLGTCVP